MITTLILASLLDMSIISSSLRSHNMAFSPFFRRSLRLFGVFYCFRRSILPYMFYLICFKSCSISSVHDDLHCVIVVLRCHVFFFIWVLIKFTCDFLLVMCVITCVHTLCTCSCVFIYGLIVAKHNIHFSLL